MSVPFVETDCTFDFQGRSFESGGAFCDGARIVAYPGKDGILNDWHGRPIGRWRATSTWRTPSSFVSPTMSSIVATVDGTVYVGRGAGEGMIFRGRRKALARTCRARLERLTRRAMSARLAGRIVDASKLEAERDAVVARLGGFHKDEAEEFVTSIETKGGAS